MRSLLTLCLVAAACARSGFERMAGRASDGSRTGDADAALVGADGSSGADTATGGDTAPDGADTGGTTSVICFAPRSDLLPCGGAGCTFPTPVAVALADLDQDGNLDLVSGDESEGIVAVHLGMGDGAFAAPADYTIQWDAQELAIADLDEDGWPDIAAVAWTASGVHFYASLGAGSFSQAVAIPGPATPVALAAADLDQDGHVDLVTGGEDNAVRILYGTGGGLFEPAVTLVSATNYYALGIGDLNGDGRLDLAAADGAATLTLLLQGAARAWAAFETAVPAGAHGVVIGRFDGDAHADVAVAASDANAVALLLGDGSGTSFTTQLLASPAPIWLASGDIDGDGALDLVASEANGATVSLFAGRGDGTFEARRELAMDASGGGASMHSFAKIALGDVNGDAVLDIVAANPAAGNIALFASVPCVGP